MSRLAERIDAFERARRVYAFLRYVAARFAQDRCLGAAAALAYTSLLALVPLLTVVFITLSAFPAFQAWREAIESFVFQNFVPALGDQVRGYLLDFADKARGLRAAGIIVLLATVLAMLSTIESTFNVIWGVKRERPIMVRFLVYWAVLTLGPVLIGAGMVATSYVVSLPLLGGGGVVGSLRTTLIAWSPLAATALAFVLFFKLIPYRPVPFRDALLGGVVASVLFELAKRGFALYVTHFPAQQAIYGAFATVPIFLLWIYLSWVVVLLGAEITQCLTTFRVSHRRHARVLGHDPMFCAYRVLYRLYEAQQAGRALSDRTLIMREPDFGFSAINGALAQLDAAGWICRDEASAWIVMRDLHQLTLHDLLVLVPSFTAPDGIRSLDSDAADEALRAPLAAFAAFARERLALPLATLFDGAGRAAAPARA
ncbi:MAG: YihY family inner membrane protein, partial [Gammaproteobacteria bacterium]